jgi:cell division protein FtsI (penicillin-binding protein 3)
LKAFARQLLSTRLDRSSARVRTIALGLFVAYAGIGVKLLALGLSDDPPQTLKTAADDAVSGARPDLLDRNGEILASDVKTMSVFAEPNRIIDIDEAVELITAVLPDVDAKQLRERLASKKGFIWVKRQITPKEQAEIFHLGLPGVGFLPENKRVYPNGPIRAHVIGFVDKDNVGIAGMEKYLDQQSLTDPHVAGFTVDPDSLKPVRLSLDLKATHALRDELVDGLDRFHAKAAAGMVVDVNTGEVLALESLPDFDPNDPGDVRDPTKINRINVGVYEMGSTFKALSLAMALESGKVNLGSHVDARDSLRYGRFTIHDFHATHRVLTVPEVFTHSSNIGAARLALMVGVEGHKAFLKKMGQLDRLRTELPESAEPLVPKHWALLNTMTIAFGQGLNVAPIQAVMAVRARQRRRDDDADISAAQRRGGGEGQPSRDQRADLRIHALSDALQRDARVRKFRQHSRLLRRRENGNRRQDHPRALFAEQGLHHLHGDHAGRQAEVSLSDDLRRSGARARGSRLPHRRL